MTKNQNVSDNVLEESLTIKRKSLSDEKFEIRFKGQKFKTLTVEPSGVQALKNPKPFEGC